MGSKIEYVESSQMYATNYVRNSKAIGMLWGVFTICYAIINVVAFFSPEYIGATLDSENPAHFGLWQSCYFGNSFNGGEECLGRLSDFSTIPSSAFKAATAVGAVSAATALLAICCMLLFFFFQSTTVFYICGLLQVVSAVCLVSSVSVYPFGWDSPHIKRTCGPQAGRFERGDCEIRWAYLLAIIGCLDAVILAVLAFILASKHVKLQPEPVYGMNGSVYKGEVNNGFMGDAHSVAGSRKSLNLHPVMLIPQPDAHGHPDHYSEFSNRTGRSKSSAYRAEYASSMQNFQL
nr:PREDICTED: lipoma HMGIC fusion partner-like 3 protein [Bemisia tabaci]XP_018902290.1 PREDICTED: lipoma HMGIC fusion partner-like 3 protein [Bemisia tabaci]